LNKNSEEPRKLVLFDLTVKLEEAETQSITCELFSLLVSKKGLE